MRIPSALIITPRLLMKPETRTWFRAIPPSFLTTALSTAHTRIVPGRFNDASPTMPAHPILYLAENHLLTLFEAQALFGSPTSAVGVVSHPRRSVTVLNVVVNLSYVADLTDLAQQAIFDTNAQELTGDWRGYKYRGPHTSISLPTGIAPTQELGAALYGIPKLESFITISAKLSDQKILVIFPDKLRKHNYVNHTDPLTGQVYPLTA